VSEASHSGTGAEASRVGAAAALLAASVLLSRLLGYLREVVLARELGVGSATDAYYAAFQIPDVLNYLLAGGALSIAFVPLYTRIAAERGHAAAERLFWIVLGTTGALAAILTAWLWWQAPALVALQFPAFDAATHALTVRLTRIVLPAQCFFVTGGIVKAVLMAHGRFRAQALSPLVYNGAIIAGGILLAPAIGAEGFAWGVLVGALFGPLLVPLLDARGRIPLRVRLAPRDPDFRRYLAVAAPLVLGLGILTVDEWYSRWFGARVGEGAIAQLSYARKLAQVPAAVLGQALAAAALPSLARLWSEGRRDELDRVVLGTLRAGIALSLVASAAVWAVVDPLVRLVYERGAFTQEDTRAVARLLAIYTLGVPFAVLQQIALRPFFARGDTWRPLLLGTLLSLLAIPVYLLLGDRLGADGLAWASNAAVAATASCTLGWGRWLHGSPALGPLAATTLRALAIAGAAALAARAALGAAPGDAGWLRAAAAAAAYGVVALAGVFTLGDAALRDAVARGLRPLRAWYARRP
jgi:putative peptidoglycan lipid II flippase